MTLEKVNAITLINVIRDSNYNLAPFDDGIYSFEELMEFVNSDNYDPSKPLNLVFEVNEGESSDSLVVSFSKGLWTLEDEGMGGMSVSAGTIEEAIEEYRANYNEGDNYQPVEFVRQNKRVK